MADRVYAWSGRRYPVDAKVVAETVDRIAGEHGRCEPGQLVDAARDKASPLHKLFTWSDREAANKWRTHEARKIINAISVMYVERDNERVTPAFISVGHIESTQDAGEGYRPIEVVAANEAFAQEAIRDVVMRLRAMRRRYDALEALAPLWKALEELEAA